eukprot:6191958-Pleurochrysis_carterae.AAC.1
MAIHASRSRHHIDVMSPHDATACLHRRLHIGASKLRRLPVLTSDAPSSLSSGRLDGYASCAEANSTKLPHKDDLYRPSHVGRLIHADIAGPFSRMQDGGF